MSIVNAWTISLVGLLALAAPASSQHRTVIQMPPGEVSRATMRAQLSFTFFVPGNVSAGIDEQRRLSEEGRRKIYEMADAECAQLQLVFKMNCRLSQVNV